MKILKLANGGIINTPIISEYENEKEYIIPLEDKAYKIYYRTKNRRIKKKQLKKSWRLQFENEIRKKITGMLVPENIKIQILNN